MWSGSLLPRKKHVISSGMLVPGTLAVLLGLAGTGSVRAAEDYQAVGHFTYTVFKAGAPTYKRIMMFEVRVHDHEWHIRTEPVVEGQGGIGFFEASLGTNDSILRITTFASAYDPAESPFHGLRDELKKSRADDVFFDNPPSAPPPAVAPPANAGTNRMNNVAVAVTTKGKYPPVDPSYVAFLWFAFTPPAEKLDGTNRMLLQVWDDGNPGKTRFRRARWDQIAEPPGLISNAVFAWAGEQLLANGSSSAIKTSDVSDPLDIAARYEVQATTNLDGLVLPAHFTLTRFHTTRLKNAEPEVLTTIVASVVQLAHSTPNESLAVVVPGKTLVTDYRLSAGELQGTPLKYVLDSNGPPEVDQIQQSKLYKGTLAQVRESHRDFHVRRLFLAVLLIFSLSLFIFWKKLPPRPRPEDQPFSVEKPKQQK